MHKLVNGKRIELSQEEEKQVLEEWEQNKLRKKTKLEEHQRKKDAHEAVIQKMAQKLEVSVDEMKQTLKNINRY